MQAAGLWCALTSGFNCNRGSWRLPRFLSEASSQIRREAFQVLTQFNRAGLALHSSMISNDNGILARIKAMNSKGWT